MSDRLEQRPRQTKEEGGRDAGKMSTAGSISGTEESETNPRQFITLSHFGRTGAAPPPLVVYIAHDLE